MKYLREFRDDQTVRACVGRLRAEPPPPRPVTFMEVCGSHTMAIHRFGLRAVLPPGIRLVSGPGCPVCVTGAGYIDQAVAIARTHGAAIATFGDLVRVPGTVESLGQARAAGVDVHVTYSADDAAVLAERNPGRQFVFLAIGFETTAPTVAATVKKARGVGIGNLTFLVAHKLVPPALHALASDPENRVDGFLCPPHVSAIIGCHPYEFLPERHGRACVVAGFEPADILESVRMLVRQVRDGDQKVENQYSRVVRQDGNPAARRLMEEVFETCDGRWRGFGSIPGSALRLRGDWRAFDAEERFGCAVAELGDPPGCRCAEILRGVAEPPECPLFGGGCTPETPVGACMVSSEGACAAWYRYDSSLSPSTGAPALASTIL